MNSPIRWYHLFSSWIFLLSSAYPLHRISTLPLNLLALPGTLSAILRPCPLSKRIYNIVLHCAPFIWIPYTVSLQSLLLSFAYAFLYIKYMNYIQVNPIDVYITLFKENHTSVYEFLQDRFGTKSTLLLSTLPHGLSILPFLSKSKLSFLSLGYISTILTSTVCSLAWHIQDEQNTIFLYLDYGFAAWWFLYELGLALYWTNLYIVFRILCLNSVVCFMNLTIPKNEHYILYHSIWHIFSSLKCVYSSWLLTSYLA
jgi:hypothetical protein